MDFITLMGSDDVQRAGHNIMDAAEDMQRAANTIQESLANHQRFLDQWLADYRDIVQPTTGEGEK